jgi:hypothetical protein
MARKLKLQGRALVLGLILALGLSTLPVPAAAAVLAGGSSTKLADFVSAVQNGDGTVVRGIYAEGLFALPVVQQPAANAGFVSTQAETLTQFGLAAKNDTFGFLAHNYLSGNYYFKLSPGQKIVMVYGDGRLKYFKVTAVKRYQALKPTSPYSDFKDLETGLTMTSTDLFNLVYKRPGQIVLQTCIDANGNSSWGRLFVIAEPEPAPAPSTSNH